MTPEPRIEPYPKKKVIVCENCAEPIRTEKTYKVDGYWCEDCFDEWVKEITCWTEDLEWEE